MIATTAPPPMLLTSLDPEAFDAAEAVIARGKDTFIEVGAAILAIRDGGRAERERRGFPTFEAYLLERWRFSRSHGYNLIAAAQVAQNVLPVIHSSPSLKQAIQLAPLEPEQQRAVWTEAVRTSPDGRPHLRDLQRLAKQEAAAAKARRLAARPAPAPTLVPPPSNPKVGQLHRGDCLEILPTLPASSVRLIITSPPFNCGWDYAGQYNDRRPLPEYQADLAQVLALCAGVLRPDGVLCVNLPQTIRPDRTIYQSRSFPLSSWWQMQLWDAGWLLREAIVWVKSKGDVEVRATSTAIGAYTDPYLRPCHEMILVASKADYHLSGRDHRWPGDEGAFGSYLELCKDVWVLPPGRSEAGEPLAFSDELVSRLVHLYSNPGDLVLDPYAGQGTTGRVALGLGREPWLIEQEPTYWPRLEALLSVPSTDDQHE